VAGALGEMPGMPVIAVNCDYVYPTYVIENEIVDKTEPFFKVLESYEDELTSYRNNYLPGDLML
jgi:hypothetical protein